MKLLYVLKLDFILSTFVKIFVPLTLKVVRTYLPPKHFEKYSQLRESNECGDVLYGLVVLFSL